MKQLKVYGDTNTLRENASDVVELEALKKLDGDKRVKWFTSNIVHYEATNTRDETKRGALVTDHKTRQKVAKDEKLRGFQSYGDGRSWISYPLLSDVQDEELHAEIMKQSIKLIDAKHLTQAACNKCDVFLTCDSKIIKRRQWLEQRLNLRILLASELVKQLGPLASRSADHTS
jgi:hypothetical protein